MTAKNSSEIVIDRFIQAIEQDKSEEAMACFTEDALIWHNFDQVHMTPSQTKLGTDRLISTLPTRSYTEIRRHSAGSICIQQHVIVGVSRDGRQVSWPGCFVFEVRGDKITRLEEYVDVQSFSKQLVPA